MSDQPVQNDPSTRVYPSKRDTWLVFLIWSVVFLLMYQTLIRPILRPPASFIFLIVRGTVGIGAMVFLLWTFFSTFYTFKNDKLLVRGGPFKWEIPLESIEKVTPTRNPLSSPAWSLDRLEVRRRGTFSGILISPQDKQEFLRDLVGRCPHLRLDGDRAVRRETA